MVSKEVFNNVILFLEGIDPPLKDQLNEPSSFLVVVILLTRKVPNDNIKKLLKGYECWFWVQSTP